MWFSADQERTLQGLKGQLQTSIVEQLKQAKARAVELVSLRLLTFLSLPITSKNLHALKF